MIDYAHIKTTYPRAWEALQLWMHTNYSILYSETKQPKGLINSIEFGEDEIIPDRDRDLYTFFDDLGLYCGCVLDEYGMIFYVMAVQNGSMKRFAIIHGNNRLEAESEGFTKAFEILEERLNLIQLADSEL